MGTEPANLSYLLLQLLFIGTRRLIFNLNLFFPPLILRLPDLENEFMVTSGEGWGQG